MDVKLSEILNLPVLRGSKVLTKNAQLETIVESVSIMESPDVLQWTKENSIILSSLFCLYKRPDDMRHFFQSLTQKPPAALFVKLGFYFQEIPDELMLIAEQIPFAIVSIPAACQYTDIIFPIMAKILQSQVVTLEHYRETQDYLINCALSNSGIAGIASAFETIVQNPVVVYDTDMSPLYATNEDYVEISTSPFKQDNAILDVEKRTFVSASGSSFNHYLIQLQVLDQPAGYLSVVDIHQTINEFDLIAMKNAATALKMEMLKQYVVDESARSTQSNIFGDILTGHVSQELLAHAEKFGLFTNRKYNIYVLEIEDNVDSRTLSVVNNAAIDRTINAITNKLNLKTVLIHYEDLTVLLVQEPQILSSTDPLLALTEKLRLRFQALSRSIYIGYDSKSYTVEDIPTGYDHALKALKINRLNSTLTSDYESLGVFRLLPFENDKQNAFDKTNLSPALRRLIEHDSLYHDELLKTLKTYFQCNRNAAATAASLYIHQKTVAYRIKKIKSVGNIDFENPMQMLDLELSIRYLNLYRPDLTGKE